MARTSRPSFFDYLNFNLPRVTTAILVAVVVALGAVQAANLAWSPSPFPGGRVVMLIMVVGCVTFAGLALVTRTRPWVFGLAVCLVSAVVYLVGLLLDAPAIRTGSSNGQVALWNLTILLPAGYVVLFWALRRGILVAHPDRRHWHD